MPLRYARAMWLVLSVLACADGPPVATAAAPPPQAAPAPVAPAPIAGRARVTAGPVSYQGVAWATAVERAAEHLRAEAERCAAADPSFQGDLDVSAVVDGTGAITSLTARPTEPPVLACVRAKSAEVPFPPGSGEFPVLSVSVRWTFAVVPPNADLDCTSDADCGLVTGICGPPFAVARAAGPKNDAANRLALTAASCAPYTPKPMAARCVKGSCASVPADLDDMRGCKDDAGCAVFERWCGWDAVSVGRLAEARSIVSTENDAIACRARPPAPGARCIEGSCTVEWVGR